MKCNACGSSNLIEGTVRDNAGGETSVFVPNDKPYYKKMFGIGNKITAHACLHCGNLQFAVEFGEEDKARYAEFEGKQPALLERISEDYDTGD